MKHLILIAFLFTSYVVSFAQTKLLINRKDGTKDSITVNTISRIRLSTSGGMNTSGIETGDTINVSSAAINSGGGTIIVSLPGTSVDGMQIIVPPNSFSSTTTFKISYSPIISHSLGQYFNPISPMISVSCDGGYSKYGMTVKIPITLPPGNFAMGFFYDENTGSVEGLPIESLGSNSISIVTSHFGTAGTKLKNSSGMNAGGSNGNIVIASVSESILNGQTIINTGFTPGVDDWEFINFGSYISDGGHCAGQSETAMWYYYEKRLKGAAPLFHLLDKVNDKTDPYKLWQDNPYGYRLSSTIQEDFDWAGWEIQMKLRSLLPGLTLKAFALSMLVTGEPQSVMINNSKGLGGHALVVYKVDYANGKLYVSDPNFPNNIDIATNGVSIRIIDFVNGKFDSYFTGLKAGEPGIEMDEISYFAKTAMIDWGHIGDQWTELENKTIGNDRFPKYTLKIQNDNDKELTDQMTTEKETVDLYCQSTECTAYLKNTDHYQALDAYAEDGHRLVEGNGQGITSIGLETGANKIGLYIMGATPTDLLHYVDFKWITIFYYPYAISPNPLLGSPGHEYTFTAKSKGKPFYFGSPKYVWTFGDNTAQVSILSDSTVTHTYATTGDYIVKVELYDQYQDTKKSEAISNAQIRTADPTMVAVTGGTFQMGNAYDVLDKEGRPIHTVTVSSYLIDKYEITYEKWTEVRNWALAHGYAGTDIAEGQNGFSTSGPTTTGANNPVTSVNWYDILKWCNARSEMDGLQPVYYTTNLQDVVYRAGQIQYYQSNAVNWTANGYRLPTEAEWEFAARGGTKSGSFKYSGSNTIGDVSWYAGNSYVVTKSDYTTHPVGQLTANELGIYDMSGNALEWVWDNWGNYPSTAQIDPKGAVGGGTNVLRGGGYNMANGLSESALRHMQYAPTIRTFAGFRCAAN